MAAKRRKLSPNQLEKRQQIVDAAKRVLLRDGLSGFTSREVARESGMTKGLIHYYFETVDEIVEATMGDLLERLMARLRATGEAHADPTERFWAVIEDYVAAFAEEPGLTLLWFDYSIQEIRGGQVAKVKRIQDGLIDLLSELIGEAGVPEADARARTLFSYVVGTLVRQEVDAQTFEKLRPEIAMLSRMETADAKAPSA
jgi:AcrR family transcriptional regulator